VEFYKIIDIQVSEKEIQENINPKNIELFAESMFYIEPNENDFIGMTLWGEFLINYNQIKGGVRFSLKDCPNAFSWTITTGYPPERNKIFLHCTINRLQKANDFIIEIEEFMTEWQKGLIDFF